MNIQKKKLISILVKIQTLTNQYTRIKILNTAKQFLHTSLVFYLIIIHTSASIKNSIFDFCKDIHIYLLQFSQFVPILTTFLLLICTFILSSILIMAFIWDKAKMGQKSILFQKIMLYLSMGFSIIFDYFALMLLVGIVSNLNLTNIALIESNIVNLFAIAVTQIIIFYTNQDVLFSNRLIFILISCEVVGSVSLSLIVMIGSAYELYFTESHRLSYLLLLAINFAILLCEFLQTNISNLQVILVFSVVMLIYLFSTTLAFPNIQSQNDFLLLQLNKLKKQQNLSTNQTTKVFFILQRFRRQHESLFDAEQNKTLQQIALLVLTKQVLFSMLLLKLTKQVMMKPNDLQLQIQQFECQLTQNNVDINVIYQAQRLKCKVIDRGNYSQQLKMQSLIQHIQAHYLRSDDQIDSSKVIEVQKKLQRFYYCVGQASQELIGLWTSLSKVLMSQEMFTQSLSKVVELEDEAHHILCGLRKYKHLYFQIQVLNYLHKIINADGSDIMVNERPNSNMKLKQTKFMLISNHIIEDASQTIAKRISPHQSLIGKDISEVLFQFYSQYMTLNIDKLISLTEHHEQVLIPFKIFSHDKKFMLAQCTFNILCSLEQGVKYAIKFIDQQELVNKYVLYCLEFDTIQAFSQNFFLKYKIDENSLPEIIVGQNFFNPDLSCLLSEQSIQIGSSVKCQLKLSSFGKKRISIRMIRHYNSYPVTLIIKEIYHANNLHYILMEIISKDEPLHSSPKMSFTLLIEQTRSNKDIDNVINGLTYCKIPNPFESVIDEKLSRINNEVRISYSKIIIALAILMVLLVVGSLIYMKIKTQDINNTFSSLIAEVNRNNNFIQYTYQLFYQYYQYYQILNFPNQLLKIYKYNITALKIEYAKKVNANIVLILPFLLPGRTYPNISNFTEYQINYSEQLQASEISLLAFLENAKSSLTLNSPIFMVRNQHAINKIINNFKPSNSEAIQLFYIAMMNYTIVIIALLVGLFFIIKIIYFKVCFFKWKILQICFSITEEETELIKSKLDEFVSVLVSSKYYEQRPFQNPNLVYSEIAFMAQQNCSIEHQPPTPITIKEKGIIKESCLHQITKNNLIILVPILTFLFFILYTNQIKKFTEQSFNIIQYSTQLQTFSILILQRATDYFQVGMQVIIGQSQRKGWTKSAVLTVPTELTVELPPFFHSYKAVQQSLLQFNLCDYAYLNTGSLYKNIDCSNILDGIMDKSFTQTYSFLLQSLQEFGGAHIEQFGNVYRPGAVYPFFMEVCYARRTINNMLAYVQTQFTLTLSQYLLYQQENLQKFINTGFIALPIFIIIIFIFSRQIKAKCNFALKCFKILPRNFIMQVGVSKKMKNNGILDQISLIAP